MQTFLFDTSIKTICPRLDVKQGDVGRKFKAVITNSGVAYTIPAGARFSVWFSGPSGEGNYSAIGDTSAFSVEGNTVTVELIAQMLRNPGTGVMCLVLNSADGSQLGLWNVVYMVEHIPGMDSETAQDYYTTFSELARQAIEAAETFETDQTLTVSGKAADAAAVGSGLSGKAPAGYGLGEQAFNAPGNDANQITKCGFFRAYVNTPTDDWWTIQQEDLYGDGKYMIQKASCYAYIHALHAERMVINGSFYEWEWVNPPMIPGVEYRTTERRNGNVVYAKLVNCGTAINDATVTLEGVTDCVRFIGYLSYPSETDPRKQLPIWSGSTIGTGYHAEITQPASPYGINQFIIKTDSNADGFGNGGYNWYVHAWYTKD